jgi:hypothetical protein
VALTLKHVFNADEQTIKKAMKWVRECNSIDNVWAFHDEPIYEAAHFMEMHIQYPAFDAYEEKYRKMIHDLKLAGSFFKHCWEKFGDGAEREED